MKTKLTKGILLIMSLLCILCVPVTPVYAAQQGAGDCSRYILICMNFSTSIPEPEDTADSTDRAQAPVTTEQKPESNKKAESGIPTLHIILFAGCMVIAIGTLIFMQIRKKKRENESPYDDEDEE